MLTEFSAAISSVNLLTQMAKTALQAHTQVERDKILGEFRETIIELYERILRLQVQMEEALRVKIEAEEKLKQYEKWEVECAKYMLTEPKPGLFVYALKSEHVGEQPAHWICPKCYESRKKSILQSERRVNPTFVGKRCPECKTDFSTRGF